jgi:prolyl 4-hydroxylase
VEKVQLKADTIFVLRDFLSPRECEQFIAVSEAIGYEDAPITTGAGFVMRKDVRDNNRIISDDPELATHLWERAKPFLPADWFGWAPVGFNERWRYYRYDVGQKFDRHTDGYFERPSGERSQFTFMIYLNDGFEGGSTDFYHTRPPLQVVPVRGLALVFAHKQLHAGTPIRNGRKYVLRTDVMYRKGTVS